MGKIIGEGITFDDVLLVPAYSEVIPNQVDLSTYLTKNGYSYRTPHGDRNGTSGGNWYHS